MPYFAKKYQVVTLDLAGHGNSGFGREAYTVEAFGQDVVAVLQAMDAKDVILVGHSIGGKVILHATTIDPERIIGLIGVDTFQDMSISRTERKKHRLYDSLVADFKTNSENFVRIMFRENADKRLVDNVTLDMVSAPEAVALSVIYYGSKMVDADITKDIAVPIKCINTDHWPTNVERNKQLVPSYELALMKGYGHFVMLENPEEFNLLLDTMVQSIVKQ